MNELTDLWKKSTRLSRVESNRPMASWLESKQVYGIESNRIGSDTKRNEMNGNRKNSILISEKRTAPCQMRKRSQTETIKLARLGMMITPRLESKLNGMD